jgi:hypothetical protein
MPKIFRYLKSTDKFTTHTFVEPDYSENEERITELCTIDGLTYISIPDSVKTSKQPKNVEETLEEVVLSDEVKDKIKKASPHIQLIYQRVRDKIAEKYSVTDELKALRERDKDVIKFNEYNSYVEECCAWGNAKKVKLGIGKAIVKL